MIINITMKTPDAMADTICEAALNEMNFESPDEMEYEDRETYDNMIEAQENILRQWFRWGEYLDIQFDTEAKTAIVMKAGN